MQENLTLISAEVVAGSDVTAAEAASYFAVAETSAASMTMEEDQDDGDDLLDDLE